MATTSKSGEAPRPSELRPEQLGRIGGGGTTQGSMAPSFVPPGIARRRGQAISRQLGTMPALRPSLPGSARQAGMPSSLGITRAQRLPQHTPRMLAGQEPARQIGGAPGAHFGGTTIAAQWSVSYANDVWFYDSQAGWQMLDGSSESGLEAMNQLLSLAREQQSTAYYDTNDQTGEVVDVYVF